VEQKEIANTSADKTDDHRRLFQKWLDENAKSKNSILISEAKKALIISILQHPKSTHKCRYNFRDRYGVLQLGNGTPILYLKKDESKFKQGSNVDMEKVISVVTSEEIFNILSKVHSDLLHGKRQKMEKKT
jgi:hypothetical protein